MRIVKLFLLILFLISILAAAVPAKADIYRPPTVYLTFAGNNADFNGEAFGKIWFNGAPAENKMFALGKVLMADDGEEWLVVFNPNLSPRSTANKEGDVLFKEVVPGRYGLIWYFVLGAVLLHGEDGNPLLITIPALGEHDMGTLYYEGVPPWGEEQIQQEEGEYKWTL